MRDMTNSEVVAVRGAGWFKEAGQAVGNLQNAVEDAAADLLTTGIAMMKNSMYQQEFARK